MINESYKRKLLMIRSSLNILLKKYPENKLIYTYFIKKSKELLLFSIEQKMNFLNLNEISTYKVTIKDLFLYCLKEEYINTDWDILVLLANKSIKGYSTEQMAFLIGVSLDKYKHLEMGYYNFKKELSYETVAEKIEFNKDEFYFTFNKSFQHIEGESY